MQKINYFVPLKPYRLTSQKVMAKRPMVIVVDILKLLVGLHLNAVRLRMFWRFVGHFLKKRTQPQNNYWTG